MPENATIAGLRWQELKNIEQLLALESQWRHLAKVCGASIFSSPDWLTLWLKHYWQADWQLKVACVFVDDSLVAMAPLYIQRQGLVLKSRCLYPLGQGEPEAQEVASEFQDLLISPEYLSKVEPLFHEWFKHLPVDECCWRAVKEGAHALHLWRSLAGYQQQAMYDYTVPVRQWSIASLSRNARSRWRRANKAIMAESAEYRWVSDPDLIATYWPALKHLHQQNWQHRQYAGAFVSAEFNHFHTHYLRREGRGMLSGVFINDEPIALNYYLVDGESLRFYQSGWDLAYTQSSPGYALHIWSILHSPLPNYDFMMGEEENSYKAGFATEMQPMWNLYVSRSPSKLRLIKSVNAVVRRLTRA